MRSGVNSGRSILLYVLILLTKVRRIPGNAAENLRLSDNVLMAVIAEGKCSFHQKDNSADIQGNGKNNL